MSDTPRSDNAIIVYSNRVAAHFPAGCLIVSLDFARTLEKDLNLASEENELLKMRCVELENTIRRLIEAGDNLV